MLQLPAGGKRNPPSRKLSGLQTCEGGDAEKEVAEDTKDYNGKGFLFQPHHSRHVLRDGAPRQEKEQQPQTHQMAGPDTIKPRIPAALPQNEQQTTGQSVRAPNVNSLHLDKMLQVVVAAVQQIMKESNSVVLEEAKKLTLQKLS
jgi:hypothetical protein